MTAEDLKAAPVPFMPAIISVAFMRPDSEVSFSISWGWTEARHKLLDCHEKYQPSPQSGPDLLRLLVCADESDALMIINRFVQDYFL